MRVRTLTEADLEGCLELFEEVAGEGLWLSSELPIDREEVRARWRDLLSSGEGTLLVAEDEGGPAGLAALVGGAAPELGMLVRATRRRQGVGDALLRAAISWARAHAAREVVLQVFRHNAAAIALYRKHGFEQRGLVRRAHRRRDGSRWHALEMALPLGAVDGGASGGGATARAR